MRLLTMRTQSSPSVKNSYETMYLIYALIQQLRNLVQKEADRLDLTSLINKVTETFQSGGIVHHR